MEALEQPQNYASVQQIGALTVQTIGGLDAEQILKAKLCLIKDYGQVQRNIKQPTKDKNGASFKSGGGYKYADLNSVIGAIQEASIGLDVSFIQQPVISGGYSGVHNYIFNSRGAFIDFGTYALNLGSPNPQDAGKALTYARRYSISSIFGIASEEDTDAKEFQNRMRFMSPTELKAVTVVYDGKRRPIEEVYAKALAGDELAKEVITDKSNSVNTKLAIKSISSVYEFNEELLKLKEKEKKEIENEDKSSGDVFDKKLGEN